MGGNEVHLLKKNGASYKKKKEDIRKEIQKQASHA